MRRTNTVTPVLQMVTVMRSAAPDSLFDFYKNAGRLARIMAARAERDLPGGITMARFELLDLLAGSETMLSPLEIAARLQLTPAAITHSMKFLSAKDLVDVTIDGNDRRARQIAVTDKGRKTHRVCIIALWPLTREILARFGPHAFASSSNLLEEFAHWLEDSNDASNT